MKLDVFTRYQTTFRGRPLPRILGFAKYWVDHFRNILLHFKRIKYLLKEFESNPVGSIAAFEMIHVLYCETLGLSNEFFHWMLTRHSPKYRIQRVKGILGENEKVLQKAVNAIKRDGYYIFPDRLPDATVSRLWDQLSVNRCYPFDQKQDLQLEGALNIEAKSPIYRIPEMDLLANVEVQSLLADPSLIWVSQEYLNCPPILDLVASWWILPSPSNSPHLPTRYHFDMDRFRWLKFFIYLTDVTETTGPHCFIEKTHRPFSQPWTLLKHNYARHNDEEMFSHYSKNREKIITGPRGTIIAVDTRGFHKGLPAKSNHRLILEFEYASHLFGAPFERIKLKYNNEALRSARNEFPGVFTKLSIAGE